MYVLIDQCEFDGVMEGQALVDLDWDVAYSTVPPLDLRDFDIAYRV